ncbi:MAG: hypothetical protein IPJ32_04580 [Sphingobacteriaceae bacterium]|nr:hypothetical protein [Sphingobacteriaceae bacterium]
MEEVKEGGKKVIQRKPNGKRDEGSLLENVIFNIEQTDRLRKLQNPSSFGDTPAEQLFSVALELCISWVDRILFLKLLEQQLVRYHKNNDYLFLNIKKFLTSMHSGMFSFQYSKKTDDRQGKWKTVFEKNTIFK